MRPVFNDLSDRGPALDRLFHQHRPRGQDRAGVGGGQRHQAARAAARTLAQSLGFDVARLEGYKKLAGPEVLAAPAFVENQLCFPVCYGLALQGMEKGFLRTNLLPREIAQNRLVSSKKPWAVASAAMILLACAATLVGQVRGWSSVDKKRFEGAETAAKNATKIALQYAAEADKAFKDLQSTDKVGVNVVESVEGRLRLAGGAQGDRRLPPGGFPVERAGAGGLRQEAHRQRPGPPAAKAIAALGQAADPNLQFTLTPRASRKRESAKTRRFESLHGTNM